MAQIKMVPAKVLVAQHSVELSEVLEAGGMTEGDGDTNVDEALVLDTLGLVSIEEQEENRSKQPKQFTREAKAHLADINRRAGELNLDSTFPLGTKIDSDRRPAKVGKTGRIRFWVKGVECYMDNTDFANALKGVIPLAAPKVPRSKINDLAAELKEVITEYFPNCALCGAKIDDYDPEVPMIYSMMNGGVLSESGNKPRKAEKEFRIHIRRLDIFCRFWDDAYSDMVIALAVDPDLDVDKFLMEKSQDVTSKIRKNRPDVTEMEVLQKLQTIHSHLRGLKATGE